MATILVVDDEPALRRVLSGQLRDAGHEVTAAAGGAEALKLSCKGPYDLVITDLIMPDKEGLETIMALRRQIPATKIIAMSGGGRNSGKDYLAIARLLGAQRTLAKPFTQAELLVAVADVLAKETTP